MIVYRKLNNLLKEKGMTWKDLCQAGISVNMPTKFSLNRVVKTDVIDKICAYLHVQPGDIMEYIEMEDLIDPKNNKVVKEKLITKPELYNHDTYQDTKRPEEYIENNMKGE